MVMDDENDVLNDPETIDEEQSAEDEDQNKPSFQSGSPLRSGNNDSGDNEEDSQIVYTNLETPDPDAVEEYFDDLSDNESSSEFVPEQMVTQDNLEIPEEAGFGEEYVPGENDVVYTNLNEEDHDGVQDILGEFGEEESSVSNLEETVSQENLEIPTPVEYGENYVPDEDDPVYTNLEEQDPDGVDEYMENGGIGDSSNVFVPEETVSQETLEMPTPVEFGDEYVPDEDDPVYTDLEEPDEDELVDLLDVLDESSDQTQEPDGLISKLEEMEQM